MNIHRKIRRAREAMSLSQTDLAKAAGVKPQAVQQWELEEPYTTPSGKVVNPTAPSRKNLPRVARALGFRDESDFMRDDDENIVRGAPSEYEPLEPRNVVRGQLPIGSIDVQRLAVRASAGPGAIRPEHDVVVGSMQVSVEWLKRHINCTAPSALRTITAYGNSMAPNFYDGDLLLMDTGIRAIDVDGVYVVSWESQLFIKRFERRPRERELWMRSDNREAHPDPHRFSWDKDYEFEVLGKAVWVWSGKKPD